MRLKNVQNNETMFSNILEIIVEHVRYEYYFIFILTVKYVVYVLEEENETL